MKKKLKKYTGKHKKLFQSCSTNSPFFREVLHNLSELNNDSIRVIGPELIFGKIFDYVGFNKIKDGLFKDLVVSRIAHPGSKLQLSQYLQGNDNKHISSDAIYYFLDKPIVVADAGLLSKDNLSSLKEKGYTFILGARIKNESKIMVQRIRQIELTDGQNTAIKKEDGTTLFISYSEKRAKKDLSNRERGLKRLEKGLNAGRLTKSNINNRGYNKYLSMYGELKIAINYEKFEADCKWDGLKGYITNTNLSGNEVIDGYNNLWKIEKAFRISKTDLKIRPIYHRLRDRMEAHICISFVSFVLYKELERVLNHKDSGISINKAIQQIKKMYGTRIPITTEHFQTVPLKNNEIQQKIIDLININL